MQDIDRYEFVVHAVAFLIFLVLVVLIVAFVFSGIVRRPIEMVTVSDPLIKLNMPCSNDFDCSDTTVLTCETTCKIRIGQSGCAFNGDCEGNSICSVGICIRPSV